MLSSACAWLGPLSSYFSGVSDDAYTRRSSRRDVGIRVGRYLSSLSADVGIEMTSVVNGSATLCGSDGGIAAV
jgi:hypothetical protein